MYYYVAYCTVTHGAARASNFALAALPTPPLKNWIFWGRLQWVAHEQHRLYSCSAIMYRAIFLSKCWTYWSTYREDRWRERQGVAGTGCTDQYAGSMLVNYPRCPHLLRTIEHLFACTMLCLLLFCFWWIAAWMSAGQSISEQEEILKWLQVVPSDSFRLNLENVICI